MLKDFLRKLNSWGLAAFLLICMFPSTLSVAFNPEYYSVAFKSGVVMMDVVTLLIIVICIREAIRKHNGR